MKGQVLSAPGAPGAPTAPPHRQSVSELVLVWELPGLRTASNLAQLEQTSRIPLERAQALLVDVLTMDDYEAAARTGNLHAQ